MDPMVCAAARTDNLGVADSRSQVLDFIYSWANSPGRRKKFLKGPKQRVNQRAISKAMGMHESTVSRVAKGKKPTEAFYQGLMQMGNYQLKSDLHSDIEDADPAPKGAFGSKYP